MSPTRSSPARRDSPVTAVAALVPVALNSVIAPEKSGIKTAADLKGKSIGTPGIPSDDVYLKAIAKKEGFPESAFKKVNVGESLLASVVSARSRRSSAATATSRRSRSRTAGLNPTVIPVTDAGGAAVRRAGGDRELGQVKSDPDYQATVKAFLAALSKGNASAVSDPAGATAAMGDVVKATRRSRSTRWWPPRRRCSTTRAASATWTRPPGSRSPTG